MQTKSSSQFVPLLLFFFLLFTCTKSVLELESSCTLDTLIRAITVASVAGLVALQAAVRSFVVHTERIGLAGALFHALVNVLASVVRVRVGQLPAGLAVQAVVATRSQAACVATRLVAVAAEELLIVPEGLVELDGAFVTVLTLVPWVAAALAIPLPRPVPFALPVASTVRALRASRSKVSVWTTDLRPVDAEELVEIRLLLLPLEPPLFKLSLELIG